MITTMFYYNYYKPYMFRAKKVEMNPDSRKKSEDKKVQALPSESKRLLLNKALSEDVVSYAHNVSYNLTSLKNSTKYINYDIDAFADNEKKYGGESVIETLKSDIETFVGAFNNAYGFYSSQKHSQSLVDFSIDIDNTIMSNIDRLSAIGIDLDNDNRIVFSPERYNGLDSETLQNHLLEFREVFESLYDQSSAMLSMPLAEHMNFKKLSYYYNYKYGGLVSDTFKLIESGLIIDKVV